MSTSPNGQQHAWIRHQVGKHWKCDKFKRQTRAHARFSLFQDPSLHGGNQKRRSNLCFLHFYARASWQANSHMARATARKQRKNILCVSRRLRPYVGHRLNWHDPYKSVFFFQIFRDRKSQNALPLQAWPPKKSITNLPCSATPRVENLITAMPLGDGSVLLHLRLCFFVIHHHHGNLLLWLPREM